MKYEHLSFDEILRIADPQTELEKILVKRFEDEVENKVEEINEEFRSVQLDGLSDALGERNDAIHERNIALERVKYLTAILDEHRIEYNK